jgi:hypothetical protein
MRKTSQAELTHQTCKELGGWDLAIKDAERLIKQTQARLRELRMASRVFRKKRDYGEPFPGAQPKAKAA